MEERKLCDIFEKLAIGHSKEFKETLLALYEEGSTEKCEERMRSHIKNCDICFGTILKMGEGDKSFVSALLTINIDLILKKGGLR